MLADIRLMTVEELELMPQEDGRSELVKGELVTMSPAGHEHGEFAGNIFGLLWNYVKKHRVGKMYTAETGFVLFRDPDTIRAPDAAFVSATRALQKRRRGFFDGPPDLAVEVMSPDDTAEEVEEKTHDYLEAGTQLVWIIHPRTRSVTTYRSLTDVRVLTIDDTLDGGDVLPGFSVPVRDIFEE